MDTPTTWTLGKVNAQISLTADGSEPVSQVFLAKSGRCVTMTTRTESKLIRFRRWRRLELLSTSGSVVLAF